MKFKQEEAHFLTEKHHQFISRCKGKKFEEAYKEMIDAFHQKEFFHHCIVAKKINNVLLLKNNNDVENHNIQYDCYKYDCYKYDISFKKDYNNGCYFFTGTITKNSEIDIRTGFTYNKNTNKKEVLFTCKIRLGEPIENVIVIVEHHFFKAILEKNFIY